MQFSHWSDRLTFAFASGFGIGLIPKGAGTVASLATIPLYCWLFRQTSPSGYLAVVVALFILGIPLAARMEVITATRDTRRTTIDEVCGVLIALIWVPLNLLNIVLGVVLFRLFDILKPPPVGIIDRQVHGGLGVMLDDVVAGIMANLALRLILHLLHQGPL